MGYEVSEANMQLEQVRKLSIGGEMMLVKIELIVILIVEIVLNILLLLVPFQLINLVYMTLPEMYGSGLALNMKINIIAKKNNAL